MDDIVIYTIEGSLQESGHTITEIVGSISKTAHDYAEALQVGRSMVRDELLYLNTAYVYMYIEGQYQSVLVAVIVGDTIFQPKEAIRNEDGA